MPNPRQQRIDIYEDTMRRCQTDPVLTAAIRSSIEGTVLYPAGALPDVQLSCNRAGRISVTKERTLQGAQRLLSSDPSSRVAILNFASATNPGGGVERGSSAQEEAICRCTTLHPCLKSGGVWDGFYRFHRDRQDARYTNACIYTPDVYVIKHDTAFPTPMGKDEWYHVDVITCAAPNLRERPYNEMNPGHGAPARVSPDELLQIHIDRATKIMKIAASHGVTAIVLGAFGCGAFQNDPEVVAHAYQIVLSQYRCLFDDTLFAVYCPPEDQTNYDCFRKNIPSD